MARQFLAELGAIVVKLHTGGYWPAAERLLQSQ